MHTYLWFARFPLYRYSETLVHPGVATPNSPGSFTKSSRAAGPENAARAAGGLHIVEIRDLRFFSRGRRPSAFTFRVTFDDSGRVLEQGLVREVP